jgi:signal transduction histidine kinase
MGDGGAREKLNGRGIEPVFVLLFLAAYSLLLLGPGGVVRYSEPTLTLLLGFVYVLIGTLVFPIVERRGTRAPIAAYFAVQLPLGVAIFLTSGVIGGTFLLLLAVAQAARVLPLPAVVALSLPLPFLHLGMAWEDALREGATFHAALIFVIAFSRAIVNADRARAEAQQLAGELATANGKLREYAAQAEDLATTRERNRLAREIHDGLGHYLTVINMQLQAARAVLDQDRPRAEATLDKAQRLSREALADIRRSVAVLRAAPTEGRILPEALAALAEESSAAGVAAALAVRGAPRRLGPQAEQALYRAAQEGLTNVRKHAGATRAELTLDYRDAAIARLEVRDDGRGAAATDGGFGLLGLRERVQLVGGAVAVETAPGAGLALMVEVPG